MRKMEVRVEADWINGTAAQYLKKKLHMTEAQIRSLKFQKEGLQRNGVPWKMNQKLQPGDLLELFWQEKEPQQLKVEASGQMPEILYEDADVICVWKPAGRVTHPVAGHRTDTIASDLVTYFSSKKEPIIVHSIGRLDKDTAGILVFAKNRIAAARLWEQRENGQFIKEYLAWCEGVFPEEAQRQEQTIQAPMEKEPEVSGEGRKMRVSEVGREATTRYQVIRQEKMQALVRLHLETGRTHQIRVHMAYIGHPLVGDSLYGHGIAHQDMTRLCAWKVRFQQPFTGEEITLSYSKSMEEVAWWKNRFA